MRKRIIATCFLAAYCALLFKWMVLRDLPIIRIGHLIFNFGGVDSGPGNLIPFKTIVAYYTGKMGLVAAVFNLVGNIALLVPVGLLAPLVCPKLTW